MRVQLYDGFDQSVEEVLKTEAIQAFLRDGGESDRRLADADLEECKRRLVARYIRTTELHAAHEGDLNEQHRAALCRAMPWLGSREGGGDAEEKGSTDHAEG